MAMMRQLPSCRQILDTPPAYVTVPDLRKALDAAVPWVIREV